MSTTLANLDWPDGQSNPAGIKSIAYFISKADITKFPILKSNPASPAELVTLDGDFELAALAKFSTIYTTQGVGKVDWESSGEKDCKAITNKASLSYPDINDQAKAFATQTLNSNTLFIIPHYVAGGKIRYCVLGNKDFDSTVDIKGSSGAKPGDQKGLTIEISAPDFCALPVYTGLIPMEDGTLNCATGEFTPAGAIPPPSGE